MSSDFRAAVQGGYVVVIERQIVSATRRSITYRHRIVIGPGVRTESPTDWSTEKCDRLDLLPGDENPAAAVEDLRTRAVAMSVRGREMVRDSERTLNALDREDDLHAIGRHAAAPSASCSACRLVSPAFRLEDAKRAAGVR